MPREQPRRLKEWVEMGENKEWEAMESTVQQLFQEGRKREQEREEDKKELLRRWEKREAKKLTKFRDRREERERETLGKREDHRPNRGLDRIQDMGGKSKGKDGGRREGCSGRLETRQHQQLGEEKEKCTGKEPGKVEKWQGKVEQASEQGERMEAMGEGSVDQAKDQSLGGEWENTRVSAEDAGS